MIRHSQPKQKTPIEEKLEQLTTLHGEDWLLDRLEVLAALEDKENLKGLNTMLTKP